MGYKKRIAWVRNRVAQNLCGMQKSPDETVKKSVLRCDGHVARMGDAKVVNRVL